MGTLTNSGKLIEKIESKQDALTTGNGISIWNEINNWRQWPCPNWFHIPSIDEWAWVKTNWINLTNPSSWLTYLHMPLAGSRNTSSAGLGNQWSRWFYWSSSPSFVSPSSHPQDASLLVIQSWSTVETTYYNRAYWFSIRCFKDEYEEPTSSWVVIRWTLWSSGIFWDQTNWLISITNGTTWYTIMDKNLWATVVYSNWDTLSEENMWYLYQWWNNYWFPSTWTISNTSSTQVDASTYWPINPYSSDTFIIWNSDWSSVQNDDLWWDTTWTYTQENVISNTGVLSVNGQTGDVTISMWSENVYCTQEEYDALPSSKLTDWKSYFIY